MSLGDGPVRSAALVSAARALLCLIQRVVARGARSAAAAQFVFRVMLFLPSKRFGGGEEEEEEVRVSTSRVFPGEA